VVLVKVGGNGLWGPFKHHDLLRMDRLELLKALAETKRFSDRLKGVKLDACTVSIVKGELPASKDEPDAADEASTNLLELKGAKTLEQAAAMAGTGTRLFVRVSLPRSAASSGGLYGQSVVCGGLPCGARGPLLR